MLCSLFLLCCILLLEQKGLLHPLAGNAQHRCLVMLSWSLKAVTFDRKGLLKMGARMMENVDFSGQFLWPIFMVRWTLPASIEVADVLGGSL
jgi:hypothetical protein